MSIDSDEYSSDGFGWASDESQYRFGHRQPNTREVAYNRANRVNIQRNLVPDYQDFMEIQRQLNARYPIQGERRSGGLFTTTGGPFRTQTRIPRWIIFHVWEMQRDRLLRTGRYPREQAMIDYYGGQSEYPPWYQSLNTRERNAFRRQRGNAHATNSLPNMSLEEQLDVGVVDL